MKESGASNDYIANPEPHTLLQLVQFETLVSYACPVDPLDWHQLLYSNDEDDKVDCYSKENLPVAGNPH